MAGSDKPFPSFCLINFVARSGRGAEHGRVFLDCAAYFRKQDMRQWWLVNLAEIARLRDEVIKAVRAAHLLEPGHITTYTARAIASKSPLQVSIPEVDRKVASDPGRADVSRRIMLMGSDDPDQRKASVAAVRALLEDLVPPKEFEEDGAPVSGPGVQFLLALAEALPEAKPKEGWDRLRLELKTIAAVNETYAKDLSNEAEFNAWKDQLTDHLDAAHKALNEIEQ
jgi:hypothetical protein